MTQPTGKVRDIDIRQTDVHTSTAGEEMNFETLRLYKWPGDKPLHSHIHKLI